MKISRRKMMAHLGATSGALLGSQFLPAGIDNLLTMALGDATTAPASTNPANPTRWEISAKKKTELAKNIVWLMHEPMDFLLRRGGEHYDDEPEHYKRMLDPENLKRMADAGVVWGRIFFYKGFGLEYERQNMQLTHQAADTMHSLGMKVSLYFAGTMFAETLYRELPEARNWEQRDQNNVWIPYGMQTFRHYPCPNEPAYREYLKKILDIGINEIKADEITFDNIMLQPEPDSCRCARCLKAFAEFLRNKYPSHEEALRRFGIPDVDWIEVNQWKSTEDPTTLKTLDDPVLQEWTRFRCQSLASYAGALYDMVKGMNPDVAALFNIKGLYSYNRHWANAVYHPLYAGKLDGFAFDTNGYDAGIDPDTGALVSQIRSYKVARQLNSSVEESMKDDLRAAVHLSFGIQSKVRGLAALPFGDGAHNVFTPLMEFFREYHARYYTETENVADVAILRNWPTMAYSINAAYVPATLMEQILIQYKIPFDLLFDEQLENLGKYHAVILAGQECVSDPQAKLLLDYAGNGGTLILAGNTGIYNDWREERHSDAFLDAKAESVDYDDWSEKKLLSQFKASTAKGKGQMVYISKIEPAVEPSSTMTPKEWVLPKNHKEIYGIIVKSLGQKISITTGAPLTTVAELVTRPSTRETIAHFVNFDKENRIDPFAVTILKQFDGPVKSVTCFSPATDDPVPIDFQDLGSAMNFSVPAMGIYSMIVVGQ
jgi:hypothetical protein